MPITQERMIEIVEAAETWESTFLTAKSLVLAEVKDAKEQGTSIEQLEHKIYGIFVAMIPDYRKVQCVLKERTHFNLRKAENLRQRNKAQKRRYRRLGTEDEIRAALDLPPRPLQRTAPTTKQFDPLNPRGWTLEDLTPPTPEEIAAFAKGDLIGTIAAAHAPKHKPPKDDGIERKVSWEHPPQAADSDGLPPPSFSTNDPDELKSLF